MADIIFFSGIIDGDTGEIEFSRVSQPFHENPAHLNVTVGKPNVEPKDPTLTVFYEKKQKLNSAYRAAAAEVGHED